MRSREELSKKLRHLEPQAKLDAVFRLCNKLGVYAVVFVKHVFGRQELCYFHALM
jgi:hypothetical protein